MPRKLKVFFHNVPVELCSSIQEGLPIVAAPYMKVIVEGLLAAAAHKYPVTICCYAIMNNHFHMIVIVHDPALVDDFVRYFKGKLAAAINKLLGRGTRTVFEEGYDSPAILDPHTFLKRMLYIYQNPIKAGLVSDISEYSLLSSWKALLNDRESRTVKRIPLPLIPELPENSLTEREQQSLANQMCERSLSSYRLNIEPWAWLECFKEAQNWDREAVKKDFIRQMKSETERMNNSRTLNVIGSKALTRSNPRRTYKSNRHGIRSICLPLYSDKSSQYNEWFYQCSKVAREVFREWRAGNRSRIPPPGFFAPGGSLLAAALLPFTL